MKSTTLIPPASNIYTYVSHVTEKTTEVKQSVPVKKWYARLSILKKISPFLLLAYGLTFILPVVLFTNISTIKSSWVALFIFPGIVVNLLLADMALHKLLNRKKKILVWLLELPCDLLIVDFLF